MRRRTDSSVLQWTFFAGKSKRLASEFIEAGFTNVRRSQLGIPVWRALAKATQMEPTGMKYVIDNNNTTIIIASFELCGGVLATSSLPFDWRDFYDLPII